MYMYWLAFVTSGLFKSTYIYMYKAYERPDFRILILLQVHVHIQYKVTIQYSNYSVVSFSYYSSSTVVLTVIGIVVNSTPQ